MKAHLYDMHKKRYTHHLDFEHAPELHQYVYIQGTNDATDEEGWLQYRIEGVDHIFIPSHQLMLSVKLANWHPKGDWLPPQEQTTW